MGGDEEGMTTWLRRGFVCWEEGRCCWGFIGLRLLLLHLPSLSRAIAPSGPPASAKVLCMTTIPETRSLYRHFLRTLLKVSGGDTRRFVNLRRLYRPQIRQELLAISPKDGSTWKDTEAKGASRP